MTPAPLKRDIEAEGVLLLFSGGSDSTLAAIRAHRRFRRVHLVTFTRSGILFPEHVLQRVEKLRRFMGDAEAYPHAFVGTDKLFRLVLYEDYFRNLRRFGTLLLSHCGLCKLSFHWRALIYCLQNGIRRVWDGAVRISCVYPEQNETILIRPLKELYARYGILYECPVYEEGDSVPEALRDLGFHRRLDVKGTAQDTQIVCTQQILFAMFLRWRSPWDDFPAYEKSMAEFYRAKLELVRSWTDEWREAGPEGISRLAPLIGQ